MTLQEEYNSAKEERSQSSRFIKLEEGESFSGQFVSVEKVEDGRFGVTRHFTFLIDGEEKIFNNKFKLMEAMIESEVTENDWVKVKKVGTSFKTKYIVNKINPLMENEDSQ